MTVPQLRADFTVKGANAAALVELAERQARALAGVGYDAEIVSMHVMADYTTQPAGEVVSWRADVEARLREHAPAEEAF